jgi:hypothetical protein
MGTPVRNTQELFALWQADIRAWWEDNLPANRCPWEWQADFLEAIAALLNAKGNVRAAVAACRGAGKTRVAAILVLWFIDTRPDCLVVTIAPIWSQVVQALWTNIRALWAVSNVAKRRQSWEVLTHEIKTDSPMWRAFGMAAKDPQNLEGRHGESAVLVIVDESKAVSEEINNSIRGMLWRKGLESLLVAIGTPGAPAGWFYRAFAQERTKWDLVRQISAWDIPTLQDRAREELERLGENNPWYRQQQLAEFAGADEFTIIPLHLIARAQLPAAAERCQALFPNPTKVMALDPAGRGADESVLSFRAGGILSGQQAWQGWDEMVTASYASGQARLWMPETVVVDEPGIGGPILSRIRELLRGVTPRRKRARPIQVIGYNPSARAFDHERFTNRKTEDLFALRDRLEAGECSLPEDAPMLVQNLASYRWTKAALGKTKVEDPDDSPDYGDSFLMTYAPERRGGVRPFSPKWL